MMSRLSLTVEVLDTIEPQVLTFTGRDAWALMQLYKAGDEGCTPLDTPGPRWSGYVHKLRRSGLEVETIREPHRGPFPGSHARYVLRSVISVQTSNGLDHEVA